MARRSREASSSEEESELLTQEIAPAAKRPRLDPALAPRAIPLAALFCKPPEDTEDLMADVRNHHMLALIRTSNPCDARTLDQVCKATRAIGYLTEERGAALRVSYLLVSRVIEQATSTRPTLEDLEGPVRAFWEDVEGWVGNYEQHGPDPAINVYPVRQLVKLFIHRRLPVREEPDADRHEMLVDDFHLVCACMVVDGTRSIWDAVCHYITLDEHYDPSASPRYNPGSPLRLAEARHPILSGDNGQLALDLICHGVHAWSVAPERTNTVLQEVINYYRNYHGGESAWQDTQLKGRTWATLLRHGQFDALCDIGWYPWFNRGQGQGLELLASPLRSAVEAVFKQRATPDATTWFEAAAVQDDGYRPLTHLLATGTALGAPPEVVGAFWRQHIFDVELAGRADPERALQALVCQYAKDRRVYDLVRHAPRWFPITLEDWHHDTNRPVQAWALQDPDVLDWSIAPVRSDAYLRLACLALEQGQYELALQMERDHMPDATTMPRRTYGYADTRPLDYRTHLTDMFEHLVLSGHEVEGWKSYLDRVFPGIAAENWKNCYNRLAKHPEVGKEVRREAIKYLLAKGARPTSKAYMVAVSHTNVPLLNSFLKKKLFDAKKHAKMLFKELKERKHWGHPTTSVFRGLFPQLRALAPAVFV